MDMDTAAPPDAAPDAPPVPQRKLAWPSGGLLSCASYISPATGNSVCWPVFFPKALLCPALLLGSNESLLQQEDPADVCCFQPQSCCGPSCRELNEDYLQLGNEGYRLCTVAMALQATCSCLCLGAPLVGWMAALQHQRVAAKYGLPPAPSLLASCLCYPHTLFQAAAALEEARLLAPPPPKPVPRSPRRPGGARAVGDGPLTSGIARARDLRAVRAASVNSEPIGLGRISNSSGVSAHPATHPGPGTPDPKPPAASQEISGFSVELSEPHLAEGPLTSARGSTSGGSGGGRGEEAGLWPPPLPAAAAAAGHRRAASDGSHAAAAAGMGPLSLGATEGSMRTPRAGHRRTNSGVTRTSRAASPIPEHTPASCAINLQQQQGPGGGLGGGGGEGPLTTPRNLLQASTSSSIRGGLSFSQEDVALSAQKRSANRATLSGKGRDLLGSWRKLRTSGSGPASIPQGLGGGGLPASTASTAAAKGGGEEGEDEEGVGGTRQRLQFTAEEEAGEAPLLGPCKEDSAGSSAPTSSRGGLLSSRSSSSRQGSSARPNLAAAAAAAAAGRAGVSPALTPEPDPCEMDPEEELLPGGPESSSSSGALGKGRGGPGLPAGRSGRARGGWGTSFARKVAGVSYIADDVCNMGSCIGPGWSTAAAAAAAAAATGGVGPGTEDGTAEGAGGSLRSTSQSTQPQAALSSGSVGQQLDTEGSSSTAALSSEPSSCGGGALLQPPLLPAGEASGVSASSSDGSGYPSRSASDAGQLSREASAAAPGASRGGSGKGPAGAMQQQQRQQGASTLPGGRGGAGLGTGKVGASSSWPAADLDLGGGTRGDEARTSRLSHLQEVVGDDTTDLTASQEELAARLAKFARHAKAYTQQASASTDAEPFYPTYVSDLCNLGGDDEGDEVSPGARSRSLGSPLEGEGSGGSAGAAAAAAGCGMDGEEEDDEALDAAAIMDDSELKGCDQTPPAGVPALALGRVTGGTASSAATRAPGAVGTGGSTRSTIGSSSREVRPAAAGPAAAGKTGGAVGRSATTAVAPMAPPGQLVMSRATPPAAAGKGPLGANSTTTGSSKAVPAPGKGPLAAAGGLAAGRMASVTTHQEQQQDQQQPRLTAANAGTWPRRPPGAAATAAAGGSRPNSSSGRLAAAAEAGPLRAALSRGGAAAGGGGTIKALHRPPSSSSSRGGPARLPLGHLVTPRARGDPGDSGRISPGGAPDAGSSSLRVRGRGSECGVLHASTQSDLSLVGGGSYVMYPSLGGGGSGIVEGVKGKTYTVTAEGGVIETQGCTLLQ